MKNFEKILKLIGIFLKAEKEFRMEHFFKLLKIFLLLLVSFSHLPLHNFCAYIKRAQLFVDSNRPIIRDPRLRTHY